MTLYRLLRSSNSGAPFVGENEGDTVLWSVAHQAWYTGPGGVGGVASWNGRAGVVVPATDDYDSDQVANVSSVAGSSVSDALDELETQIGAAGAAVYGVLTMTDTLGYHWDTPLDGYTKPLAAALTNWNGSSAFAVENGGLKYTGPSIDIFLVWAVCLMPNAVNVDARHGAALSHNDDLVGLEVQNTLAIQAGAGLQFLPVGILSPTDFTTSLQLTATRKVTIASGDVIMPVVATEDGAATFYEAVSFSLSVYTA